MDENEIAAARIQWKIVLMTKLCLIGVFKENGNMKINPSIDGYTG